jgi:hypothetical protein
MTPETETSHRGLNSWWNMMMRELKRTSLDQPALHNVQTTRHKFPFYSSRLFILQTTKNGCTISDESCDRRK